MKSFDTVVLDTGPPLVLLKSIESHTRLVDSPTDE